MQELETYYAKRAKEHDKVYFKPERQADLTLLRKELPEMVEGKKVLDIGCGTGYWTQYLSQQAASITGIDINQAVLNEAALREYGCTIYFQVGSYYELSSLNEMYEVVFGGFVYSHVPKEKEAAFFHSILEKLAPGGQIILLDNKYVEGSSTPIARTDAAGNTYQTRKLESGERFEILKNFPEEQAFLNLSKVGLELLTFQQLPYYWKATLVKTETL
ncbi:MAG: methyltransferase domain-containing protein [Bacteroidota bacterium]